MAATTTVQHQMYRNLLESGYIEWCREEVRPLLTQRRPGMNTVPFQVLLGVAVL